MRSKKGIEMQFNWLFVLVAGAAILLFFAVVIVKQKSIAEASTKATVLKSIEAIITSAGISTDTINTVTIPNSNIEVSCGRLSLGAVSKQSQNLILFAPSLIKGDKLITQTSAFNVPYRATNLLYATSPQLRYIIIGNTNLAREINKSLPSDLKKEFYQSTPEIRDENNYRIRFVLVEDMIDFPKALEKMPNSDVTAIRIIGGIEKGKIEFYQKDGSSWLAKGKSVYIGKSPLIGALYADTVDLYECNMKNAFSKLNLVTKIYSERARELIKNAAVSSRQVQCNEIYNKALTQLNSIFAASLNFDEQNVNALTTAEKLLIDENKRAQAYSCALVY